MGSGVGDAQLIEPAEEVSGFVLIEGTGFAEGQVLLNDVTGRLLDGKWEATEVDGEKPSGGAVTGGEGVDLLGEIKQELGSVVGIEHGEVEGRDVVCPVM